jgi:putative salt-induced outer membrane protein YdiY
LSLRMLYLVLSTSAILSADQVVLTNGDIITGSIIKKDGATLTMNSKFLGDVTMPWTAVKSLTSDTELTVVLPGGESVNGKISTTGDTLEVVTSAGTKSAPLTGVSGVRNAAEQHAWERLEHPRLLDLWAGAFDFGLALVRGNARTDTTTTALVASRVTRNDKASVYLTQISSSARVNGVSSPTARAIRGGWAYNRDLTPRLFATTFNDYDHDRFQNLDLRFVLGGGVGFYAVKTDALHLDLLAGADYNHEKFSTGLSRNSAEANFGDNLLYKLSAATSVTQSFRVFTNLSNTGQYRLNFDLSGVTAIKKWLGWHVTASDRFLSNPDFGRQRNDILLSTGLRLTFAR